MQRLPPMTRLRDQSFNRLIPNILTLLGLCAGMTAVRLALLQRWELAVAAIAVAAVLDALDGRIARLLDTSSKFGAELDSLADVVGFGVVPGLLLYIWTMHDAGGLGWAVTLLFAVCCSLRLARFEFGPGWYDKPLFVGVVMVTVAALMVSRVPTYSFKRLKVPAKSVLPTMIGIGLLIAFVISTPWFTFLAIAAAYLATMPVSVLAHRRLVARRTV